MKVISLKEPYATLIAEKKKKIETRSWKTNYRGEIYIHASVSPLSKKDLENKEFMNLVSSSAFSFGHIICKATLVDCVFMTEEYVQTIKENHFEEYLCGLYQVGRYAWILENITPLKYPIKAKGQLAIWNYYNELEIMELMNSIQYGWMSKKNKKNYHFDNDFASNYFLQSPQEIIKNRIGICWDQVELERYYFRGNDWNTQTYFLVYDDHENCPTHTFLTFEKENKVYWFEHAWEIFKGIHEYSNRNELLLDVIQKFIHQELRDSLQKQQLFLFLYQKPTSSISVQEFYDFCSSGTRISWQELEQSQK